MALYSSRSSSPGHSNNNNNNNCSCPNAGFQPPPIDALVTAVALKKDPRGALPARDDAEPAASSAALANAVSVGEQQQQQQQQQQQEEELHQPFHPLHPVAFARDTSTSTIAKRSNNGDSVYTARGLSGRSVSSQASQPQWVCPDIPANSAQKVLWRAPGHIDDGVHEAGPLPAREKTTRKLNVDRSKIIGNPSFLAGTLKLPAIVSAAPLPTTTSSFSSSAKPRDVLPSHDPYDWAWLGAAPSGRWVVEHGRPRCVEAQLIDGSLEPLSRPRRRENALSREASLQKLHQRPNGGGGHNGQPQLRRASSEVESSSSFLEALLFESSATSTDQADDCEEDIFYVPAPPSDPNPRRMTRRMSSGVSFVSDEKDKAAEGGPSSSSQAPSSGRVSVARRAGSRRKVQIHGMDDEMWDFFEKMEVHLSQHEGQNYTHLPRYLVTAAAKKLRHVGDPLDPEKKRSALAYRRNAIRATIQNNARRRFAPMKLKPVPSGRRASGLSVGGSSEQPEEDHNEDDKESRSSEPHHQIDDPQQHLHNHRQQQQQQQQQEQEPHSSIEQTALLSAPLSPSSMVESPSAAGTAASGTGPPVPVSRILSNTVGSSSFSNVLPVSLEQGPSYSSSSSAMEAEGSMMRRRSSVFDAPPPLLPAEETPQQTSSWAKIRKNARSLIEEHGSEMALHPSSSQHYQYQHQHGPHLSPSSSSHLLPMASMMSSTPSGSVSPRLSSNSPPKSRREALLLATVAAFAKKDERKHNRDLKSEIKRLKEQLYLSAQTAFGNDVWERCGIESEHLKRQQLAQLLGSGLSALGMKKDADTEARTEDEDEGEVSEKPKRRPSLARLDRKMSLRTRVSEGFRKRSMSGVGGAASVASRRLISVKSGGIDAV